MNVARCRGGAVLRGLNDPAAQLKSEINSVKETAVSAVSLLSINSSTTQIFARRINL